MVCKKYVLLHVCRYACIPVCMHTWRPNVDVSSISQLSPALFFEEGSLGKPRGHVTRDMIFHLKFFLAHL